MLTFIRPLKICSPEQHVLPTQIFWYSPFPDQCSYKAVSSYSPVWHITDVSALSATLLTPSCSPVNIYPITVFSYFPFSQQVHTSPAHSHKPSFSQLQPFWKSGTSTFLQLPSRHGSFKAEQEDHSTEKHRSVDSSACDEDQREEEQRSQNPWSVPTTSGSPIPSEDAKASCPHAGNPTYSHPTSAKGSQLHPRTLVFAIGADCTRTRSQNTD